MNVSTRTTLPTIANSYGTQNDVYPQAHTGRKPVLFMRWLFALCMVALSVGYSNGQTLANYTFSTATNASLEDISVGYTDAFTGTPPFDIKSSSVLPIGFPVLFMGKVYTYWSVNADGQVRLHTTSGATAIGSNLSSPTLNEATFTLFSGDNMVMTGVRYKIMGTAPNRKLVVEWNGFSVYWSSMNNAGNMQLWLSETSNRIDYVYGEIYNSSTSSQTRSIFISSSSTATTAGSITINTSPTAPTFALGSSPASNTIAAGTNPTGTTVINNIGSTAQGSRRIFSWVPSSSAIAGPTSLSFSNVGLTGLTLNWNASSPQTGVLGYAAFASSDGGLTYNPVASVSGSGTVTVNVTGLTPNTTYLWQVYAYAEGNLSSTSADDAQATNACGMSGTITVGATGTYTNLTAALAALSTQGAAGPVIFELQSDYSSSGETFPLVLGNVTCMSATNTVTIRPASGATVSVTGANTTSIFDFNGGKYYIIDGRQGGSGTPGLTISNSGNGPALRFINEGANNTVKYASIVSGVTSTSSGVILFSTTTGVNGNSNNTLSNNDISGNAAAANLVYSSGTSGKNNSGETISANNFHDQFVAGSATSGIYVSTNSTGWIISGNSFYQTAARTYTTTNSHYGIYLATGDGYSVTNNYIGGSQANAGGTAYTLGGTVATTFRGIYSAGSTTTANTITGNTISNISLTSSSTTSTNPGVFNGIYLSTGGATINSNTISNISVTSSASAGISSGIASSSTSTANVTINSNSIGGITINGSSTSYGSSFYGIWNTGSLTGSLTINGNTIGHNANANSIYFATATTGTSGGTLVGIFNSGTPSSGISITNNIIANLNSNYAPSAAFTTPVVRGILASSGVVTISGNTIHDLKAGANATGSGASAGVQGISVTTATSGTSTATSNTIYSLENSHATSANTVSGIYWAGPTGGKVSRNLVYAIYTPSTIGFANGIQVNSAVDCQNNMVRLGIDASGASKTTASGYNGIYVTAAANIFHNTVYIGGTGVNTAPATATYAFNSTVTTGTRQVLDNIFINERSSASAGGKHYAIRLAGITGLTINGNDYVANGAFTGVLGSNNGTDVTSLVAWKSFTTQDVNSISANPCLANPTAGTPNLHLTDCSGAGSPADGAGVVSGVVNDFDGDVRANFTPIDMGADAGNYGLIGVNVGLSALVTPGPVNGCYTNAEAVTVTLNNYGVNTIDFSINPVTVNVSTNTGYSSSIVINTGTLAANATQAVIMPATIDMTTSATYTFNGSATVTGDVNTVNDAMPAVSRVVNSLGGTYTVGAGGNYPTLTAAVAAYNNANCLTGAVVFSLTDATYGSETYPITINQHAQASSTKTLTIKPATGVTAAFSGNATALVKINGGDYITLDGSNNGTNTRDLTFTNTATSSSTVIWVSSIGGAGNGANHVSIKNLNIVGGSNTSSSVYGITSAGTTYSSAAADNDYLTIQNNRIEKVYTGIWANYSATAGLQGDNLVITQNSIGSADNTKYVLAQGINVAYVNAPVISNNTVFNMFQTASVYVSAIYIGAGVNGGTIDANTIKDIQSTATGGYGAYGINFGSSTATSGVTVSNNMISGILTANYSTTATTDNGFGIRITGGNDLKIYHNSINMYGNVTNGSNAGMSANMVVTSAVTGLDVRNNIFVNTQDFAQSGSKVYNIYLSATPTFAFLDNNDYYGTSTGNTSYKTGYLTSDQATLADWKAATGKDANSLNIAPVFTSPSDLHLVPASNSLLDNKGTNVGITTDYDGDSRSLTTPDMGADEFTAPVVLDVRLSAVTAPSNSGCYSNAETVTVTVTNNTPFAVDLTSNPVTVTVTATGGYSSTTTLNTGVLAGSGSQSVTMPATIDMSAYGSYTFNGSATIAGDINTGNDALAPAVTITGAAVSVGTIAANPSVYCVTGGTPTITLTSAANGSIQWQESTVSNAGPWTNVGTNSLTYTPGAAITGTTYYQAIVACAAQGTSVTSNVDLAQIFDPQVASTTPASRCGDGTVTLGATPNAGATIKWYDAATGGNLLGSGNNFVTPSLNATTTYYAEASRGNLVNATLGDGALTTSSSLSPYYHSWGGTKHQYLIRASELTAAGLSAGPINSASFNVTTAGTSYTGFTMGIGSTTQSALSGYIAGATTVYTGTTTPVQGMNTYTFSTSFNWDGTSNIFVEVCFSNNNSGGTSAAIAYDNTSYVSAAYSYFDNQTPAYVCGSSSASTLSQRPQIRFVSGAACFSARTAVTATVTTPPTISVSASNSTICSGQSTNLSATSSNDPAYTYTWMPGNLSGANPSVSPNANTTYTVNAVDNTNGPNAGCANSGTISITVNPAVTNLTVSASTQTVCVGGSVNLTASANSGEYVNINYTEGFESGIPANWAVINAGAGNNWGPSSSYTHTGTGSAVYNYNSANPANTWMITQGFALAANVPVTISFWELTSTSFPEKLKITAGTGQTVNDQTTEIFNYGAHNVGTYTQRTLTFTPSSSGTYYFGFNCYSDADEYYLAIDDVNITSSIPIPASYTWTPGNLSGAQQNGLTPVEATTYEVTASNSFGCSATGSVTVNISNLALPTPTFTDVLCHGGSTGSLTATATGGTSPYEYSIDGNNWQASGSFTGLAAGTYTVQVRDANAPQCTVSASTVTIAEPAVLTISVDNQTDPSCHGAATGSIQVTATGGNGSYTYSIAGPTVNNTGDGSGTYSNLLAGTYTITATDIKGCTVSTSQVTLTEPAAPALTVNNYVPVCDGADVTLTATAGYATYSWTGPGTINNANQATATGVAPTNNAVYSVTITDANGCTNSGSTTVSVTNNEPVSVSIVVAPGNEVCSDANVTFTATAVNGGATPGYQWYLNGLAQAGETNSTYVAGQMTDQDQVYCEVTSSLPCTTGSPATSNTITMTVSGLIMANVTLAADQSAVCNGTQVTLTATGSGTGNFPVYDFYVNNNLVQTGSSTTYTYTPANGDQVYVDMTSSFSCAIGSPATSNTEAITVNPIPAAPSITADGATTFCNGGSVTLTSSYVGGNTWSTNETTDAITVTTSGSYTVTQTALGCTSPASAPVVVTVNANPTAAVTGPASVCTGSTITLSAATSVAGSGTISTYQWYNGITPMGTASTQDVTAGGTYTVTVTNSNSCANTSAAFTVTENTPPTAGVTATCVTLGPGQTSVLTATPATGVTYSWTLNGGPQLSSANPYTTAPNVGGTYMVTVTDVNNSCTASATQVISAMTGALVGGNTYPVPSTCGGFPTIAAAVSYLNTNGVTGTGDVTIAVTPGYSETVPATGLVLTASGTATNQIKFVKAGPGTVTINAGSGGTGTPGTAVIDAMFKIVGGDYITINGFTFTDGNNANPATMEAGIALLKAGATNGAQYNTISNNTFNMQRVNNATASGARADGAVGVAIYNTTNTASAAVTVTAASGANSYNKVYGNTINSGNTGVALIGFADVTPFNYADRGNDVGGASAATGNSILNFGGGASTNPAAGVRTLAQYDLNVSYNTVNNNNGSGVNHATTLRGIYIYTATSASETITHNTVTVTSGGTTSSLTGIENAAGSTAASNTVSITDNIVTTNYATVGATSGVSYGIYNSASAANVNMNNNTLSMSANTSSGTNAAIYNSGAVGTALNINSNAITGQTFTKAGTENFYGIYVTSLSGSGTIDGNSISGVNHGSLALTGGWQFVYKSASGTTETITNNVLNNVTINSSGSVYLFYLSNSNTGGEVANNSVNTQFVRNSTGSGSFYGIYNFSSAGGLNLVHDNNFSNISLNSTANANPGSSGGSQMIFWGTVSSSSVKAYNNILNNITQAGTGSLTGIALTYGKDSIYNNTMTNWTGAGNIVAATTGGSTQGSWIYGNTIKNLSSSAASGTIYGVYVYSNSYDNAVYSNQINTLTASGATNPLVHGIYVDGGVNNNVYKNKIYGLSASGAFTTGTGVVNGITLNSGTTNNVYNNYVGSLTAPAGSSTDAVRGINITSTLASSTENVSFNTVYLNASSTGTNFGTSGLYAAGSSTATSATLNLRSNIVVNTSTAAGTGLTAAYRRSNTSLDNYSALSNKNLYYAGTPSATNLIFADGTNARQTLGDFKSLMATRDADSKTENPPFLSTNGNDATYLHINPMVQTLVESGAVSVAGITDDYDGDIRFGEVGYTGTSLVGQDIGADEFNGIAPDCNGASGGIASPATASVCFGTASTFNVTGASSGAGISYQWMVSNTAGGPYNNVVGGSGENTVTYTTPATLAVGTYYYVLQVHCTHGGVTDYSTEIAFTVKPIPTATALSNSPVCSGSALNLTGGSDVGTSFAWTGPNGFANGTQSPSIASPTTAATGTYSLVATLNGCSSTTATTTVVVNETPGAVTVSPASAVLCQGATQQLTATGGTLNTPITLYSQGFNDVTNDWTTTNLSTGGTPADAAWTLRADGYIYSSITFHSNDNSQFYMTNSDDQGSGGTTDTYLTSPALSTLGKSQASVSFYHYYKPYNGDQGIVQASTDGTNWTTLQTFTSGGSAANFANASVALTAPFLNQPTVYVRFHYMAGYDYYWAIDNVSLTTPATAPILWSPAANLYLDAGATQPYTNENVTTVYVKSNTSLTVTATATNNGCSSAGTANMTINPSPVGSMVTVGANTVCQNTTVPITFTGTSGTAPYTFTYTINGGAPQTATTGSGANPQSVTINAATNAAGTFTYAVTNVADIYCSSTISGSYVVTVNPNYSLNVASVVTDKSACGPLDGSITLQVTGGTGTYNYAWTGVIGSGNPATTPYPNPGNVSAITGLQYGFYNVTVTDVGGCGSQTLTNIHVGLGFLPVVTAQISNSSSCSPSGIVNAYANGGVAPYTFQLDGGPAQGGHTFTGVAAGSHVITAIDAKGCSSTLNVTVGTVAAVGFTSYAYSASSCSNDGSIQIYRSGGVPPYSYSVDGSPFVGNSLFTGLSAGAHAVTIKDGNGCTSTQSVTVGQGASLTLTANVGMTSSCINDGAIQATVSGGVGPYTYHLNNGPSQGSALFTGLAAGTYAVNVTDSRGCTGTVNATINVNNVNVTFYKTDAPNCQGTGSIQLFRTGGVGPYTYSLDGNNYQASPVFNNLPPGTYTGYVKDSKTCVGQTVGDAIIVGPENCNNNGRVIDKPQDVLVTQASVKAFPNPSVNEFTLDLKGFNMNEKVSITVTDLLGRKVYQTEGMGMMQYKVGRKFFAGVYNVIIVQGNRHFSLKLVKE